MMFKTDTQQKQNRSKPECFYLEIVWVNVWMCYKWNMLKTIDLCVLKFWKSTKLYHKKL